MKPTLLVLAAGMGSRYGGLKQVDGIGQNGEAIIEYSVFDAIRAGFGKVVFVIREDIEDAFKAKFANKFDDKIEVAYAFQAVNTPIEGIDDLPERKKPWGTAHAVLVAEHVINEPFAVINADDYYGIDAFYGMAKFLQEDCAPTHWSMIGYILGKTLSDHGMVNRGVASMDNNYQLTSLNERLKIKKDNGTISYLDNGERFPLQASDLVSMNYFGFHPSIFAHLKTQFKEFVENNKDKPTAEFFIPLIVNRLVQNKTIKMSVIPSEDQWYGVTYQEDKPIVQKAFDELVSNQVYPLALW